MDKQYKASDVRDLGRLMQHGDDEEIVAGEMLEAYADLLEAREKAVPVAYILKHEKISFKPTVYYGEVETLQRKFDGEIVKLYTHPAPSDADWKNNVLAGDMKAIVDGDGNVLYVNKAIFDQQAHKTEDALATVSALTTDAERLAEALRGILEIGKRNMENQKYDGFFNAAREALAAHSAQAQPPANQDKPVYAISRSMHSYYTQDEEEARQAEFDGANVQCIPTQPPAASVTDAMIMRAVKAWTSNGFGSPGQVFSIYSVAKVMLEAALATQENPNG